MKLEMEVAMPDKIIFLIAYGAFAWGISLALELPAHWDEETLVGYLVAVPCFTILALIANDNIAKIKRR